MEKHLYICNSVYQILVALWIKHHYYKDVSGDIIVSDHIPTGENLAQTLRDAGCFNTVYYAKTQDFAKFKVRLTKKERIQMSLFPDTVMSRFVKLEKGYTKLFAANVDYFTQLAMNMLYRSNPDIKLTIFEDGIFTYTTLYEKDYMGTEVPIAAQGIHGLLHKYIYRTHTVFGNVAEMLLFNPDNLAWNPPFPVTQMNKIDQNDHEFRMLCNKVFSYEDAPDVYDRKYIFIEESFFAEGAELDDLETIEKLAERVGRDNIMVKIHPRNPVNRFAKLGYKTNRNVSVPWEVVLMNMKDLSDKALITVSSSAVLNPILIFGQKVPTYSIYYCVDHENCHSRLLCGEMWDVAYKLFTKYSDTVTVCHSIDEIV